MKKRICKICGVLFETSQKYAKICPICKKQNHFEKRKKNLFNGK